MHGSIITPTNFQSVLAIGGGGYSKSMDIANDGTKVSSVDIYGAFIAQPGSSSAWSDLITETSFASMISNCAPSTSKPGCWQGDGPYDVRIAHANSQFVMIHWNGQVYLSTNQGATFASASGPNGLPIEQKGDTGGNGGPWCAGPRAGSFQTARINDPKSNIDPTQATIGSLTAIVPTARYGTYITHNGGATWSLLPLPQSLWFQATSSNTVSSTSTGTTINLTAAPSASLTAGWMVYDLTNPAAIPTGTFWVSSGASSVVVSTSVSVTASDSLIWINVGSGPTFSVGTIFAGMTAVTSGSTAAAGTTLTIPTASIPNPSGANLTPVTNGLNGAWQVSDLTNPLAIPPNTYFVSQGTNSVTINKPVAAGQSVATGDTIQFNFMGVTATATASRASGTTTLDITPPAGALENSTLVIDQTNPAAIPEGTQWTAGSGPTITLSNATQGTGVASGDVISFLSTIDSASAGGNWGCRSLELVAFDPSNSNNIFVSVPGTGIWHSTDGGTTWARLNTSGMPPEVDSGTSMVVGNDGFLYFMDEASTGSATLYTWNATTGWANTGKTGWGVAVDPQVGHTGFIVLVGASGSTCTSQNHGGSFACGNDVRAATDVPWLGVAVEAMNTSEIMMDRAQAGVVYMGEGIGVWHSLPVYGSTSTVTWTSQTAAIESLTASNIVASPAYTFPFVQVWDRGEFSNTNPASYNSPGAVQYPLSLTAGAANAIVGGWGGDWAESNNGTTVCLLVNSNFGAITSISACTNDGSTWTQFPVEPDAIGAVTTSGSVVAATQLNFTGLSPMLYGDPERTITDQGTVVTPSATIGTAQNVWNVSAGSPSLASILPGDLITTIGPGYLVDAAAQAGYPLTPGFATQGMVESVSGTQVTANLPPQVSLGTSQQIAITQGLQVTTNQLSPNTSVLCFAVFPAGITGTPITGPGIPHNTHIANDQQSGAGVCTNVTVTLSNATATATASGTTIGVASSNSPLPLQTVAANVAGTSGNSSTTVVLQHAIAYTNTNSANNQGVRAGETIMFQASLAGSGLAVSSPLNAMYIMSDSGNGAIWPLFTTDGGNTWNPAILCGSSCGTLAGFDSLGRATSTGCYDGAFGAASYSIAADKNVANTFYVVNWCGHGRGTGIGIYKSSNGGVTWTQQLADTPDANSLQGGGAGIISVPGEANQIWFSHGSGNTGSHGTMTSGGLYRSCDQGVTWFPVDSTNLANVWLFAFGKGPTGGNGYPSVYIYGYVNGAGNGWGVYRGDNPSLTCGAGQTVTWTKVGDQFTAGKLNVTAQTGIVADLSRFGYWYLNATGGSERGFHN